MLYFYNPPSVFWGLWNSLKGLLPEVTRSKIKVIDPSDLQQLQEAVPVEVHGADTGPRHKCSAAVAAARLAPYGPGAGFTYFIPVLCNGVRQQWTCADKVDQHRPMTDGMQYVT
jgi:hypothetical protein